MHIGVLGTCQASGIVDSVRALLPGVTTEQFFIGNCDEAAALRCAGEADFFITQQILSPEFGALCTPALPQDRLGVMPIIAFTGFHPDLTVVPEWGVTHSPWSGYHSALVVACHVLKLPAERVPPLFNAYVYESLAYFAEMDRARAFLIKVCADLGYDIADRIDAWCSETSFMHTFNHPAIEVLFDLTRMCLLRAGLIDASASTALPQDQLAILQWPVHRFLADRLRIAPMPSFRTGAEELSLPDFVARSYASYRDADERVLAENPAVARALPILKSLDIR